MTDTFTWKRQAGATGDFELIVSQVKFGDGYSQVVPLGLNNKAQTWPLTFEGGQVEMQEIYDFLSAHKGGTSFFWTPPLGTQGYFKCKKFSITSVGGEVYRVSATFDEFFEP